MMFSHLSSKIEKSYLLTKKEFVFNLQLENQEIIDLSISAPSLDLPYELVDAFLRNIQDKTLNKYVPSAGIMSLRELLAASAKQDYHSNITHSNIAVTSGARGGLSTIMQALLNPGDEVLLFSPYWSEYPNQLKLIGAVPKIIPLDEEDLFHPEMNKLDKLCNSRTKMIIINNPHNPTGVIWDEKTIKALLEWAKKKNIFVISDEVCSLEVFDNHCFTPTASIQSSFDNLAIVQSFSKHLAVPGWRIGWVIGHPDLISKIETIQNLTSGGVHSTTQHSLVEAWNYLDSWFAQNLVIHQERLDELYGALAKVHGFRTIKPQGGMSLFTNIQYYLGNEVGGEVPTNAEEFCNIIFKNTGVLISSGEIFGRDGFVRFCFTQENSTLSTAIAKISAILEK